jgi:hypothetical protein
MRLAYPTGGDLGNLLAWAKRLVEDLNRTFSIDELPVASDDEEAAAKNIKLGAGYVTAEGIVRRRVT